MENLFTPSNIMFVIGILGIIFSVFQYFRNPQVQLEKNQAVNDERDKGKEMAIDERINEEKKQNERRFDELGKRLDTSMTLAQNHIHTVDTKVDNLASVFASLRVEVAQLHTIIDERIPKK